MGRNCLVIIPPQRFEDGAYKNFVRRTFREALQKPPCQAGWNKNVLFGFS